MSLISVYKVHSITSLWLLLEIDGRETENSCESENSNQKRNDS